MAILLPPWWAPGMRERWAQEEAEMAEGFPSFRVVDRYRYRALPGCLAMSGHGRQYLDILDRLRQFQNGSAAMAAADPREQLVAALADPGFAVFLGGHPESYIERIEREQCGDLVRTWRGEIRPFGPDTAAEEVEKIIADLDHDVTVTVEPDGKVRHYAGCTSLHKLRAELRPARPLAETYLIEIAYRTPPGHPIVRGLRPKITRDRFPDDPPPHLLEPLNALCLLFPSDGRWKWPQHGAREYAEFAAIWLAKHTVWLETRERLGKGIWIGSAVRHGPSEMLKALRPDDECYCGSARLYGACCRDRDIALAQQGM